MKQPFGAKTGIGEGAKDAFFAESRHSPPGGTRDRDVGNPFSEAPDVFGGSLSAPALGVGRRGVPLAPWTFSHGVVFDSHVDSITTHVPDRFPRRNPILGPTAEGVAR